MDTPPARPAAWNPSQPAGGLHQAFGMYPDGIAAIPGGACGLLPQDACIFTVRAVHPGGDDSPGPSALRAFAVYDLSGKPIRVPSSYALSEAVELWAKKIKDGRSDPPLAHKLAQSISCSVYPDAECPSGLPEKVRIELPGYALREWTRSLGLRGMDQSPEILCAAAMRMLTEAVLLAVGGEGWKAVYLGGAECRADEFGPTLETLKESWLLGCAAQAPEPSPKALRI